jgi:hypothetical protein
MFYSFIASQASRTCISLSKTSAIQIELSFHRHSQIAHLAPRAAVGGGSQRFYHRSFTFPSNLAPSKPTEKSIFSPLHHSSSSTIASLRSEAIARHLSTGSSPSSATMSYSKQSSEFTPRKIGALHTNEYRCFIESNGTPVSPFHDIPLYANEQQTILNMVVEIPRWSNAKLEVSH